MTLSEFMDYLSRVDAPDTKCGFDMNKTAKRRGCSEHPCGSACCIGGHAALLLGRHMDEPELALAELVGIKQAQAHAICWPEVAPGCNPYSATLQQALRLLEHYSATGEVNWPRAMEAV